MNEQKFVDLVDFQKRLNASLDDATRQDDLSSLIGFQAAGRNWLVDLGALREIEAVPGPEKIHALGLTKPWVHGVANFKGYIYTLVDFQMFLGLQQSNVSLNTRALLFHARHALQTALIVPNVTGLVSKNEMPQLSSAEWEATTPWSVSGHRSADGKVWEMISIDLLSDSKELLEIEAV